VEIWGELESQNRFLRRLAVAAFVFSFLALAGGSFGFYVGVFTPIAYHVDSDGHAAAVGRLRQQGDAPADAEVRYVTKEFLKRRLAWNSLTVEGDLAAAENLMTDEARRESDQFFKEYETQYRRSFVADLKPRNIQTLLNFDDEHLELRAHQENAFTVRLRGRRVVLPINAVGEEAAIKDEDFEAVVMLVRAPRTEKTPNGLLVHKFTFRTFEAAPKPLVPETQSNPMQPSEAP